MESRPIRRPYLAGPTPLAIAHRGGGGEHPENTMAAFAAAVALGCTHVETDVQLTRDRVLVAFHDDSLDRVTDGHGRIADLTLAEVRHADAGYRFSPAGAGFPFRGRGLTVPTFEELLTAWPQLRVNVDAKSEATVAPLAALIERLGATERVCAASFSDRRLRRFRRLSGGRVCTSMGSGAIARARLASLAGRMPAVGADCVQVPLAHRGIRIVDRRFVAAAHRGGLPVHVWTVDDEATMERLVDLGVDGIMTDRPSLLREVLRRRGLWLEAAPATPA
ncbi:MAG: glycerophosphodiester phosphodiesterase [Candidatus Dormibacteria bacterium]|jgi:glycerophosphoryl diester phosphodiesterase